MKNLSRKSWIILGSITVPVAAFAIAIPVASSKVKHDKEFKVSVASANGPRFFITEMDTQQNRPAITGLDIWDIDENFDAGKKEAAKLLGLGTKYHLVITTMRKTESYNDGLGKLLYQLMYVKDNADDLTMLFKTAIEGVVDSNVVSNKQFLLKDFPTKTVAERAAILKDLITKSSATKPAKGSTDAENEAYLGNMINAFYKVKLIVEESAAVVSRETTLDDIKAAFDKIITVNKITGVTPFN